MFLLPNFLPCIPFHLISWFSISLLTIKSSVPCGSVQSFMDFLPLPVVTSSIPKLRLNINIHAANINLCPLPLSRVLDLHFQEPLAPSTCVRMVTQVLTYSKRKVAADILCASEHRDSSLCSKRWKRGIVLVLLLYVHLFPTPSFLSPNHYADPPLSTLSTTLTTFCSARAVPLGDVHVTSSFSPHFTL